MSVRVHRSAQCRHVVLRISAGEVLPDALAAVLRDEKVASGWLRASGVIEEVELRAFDAEIGSLGKARRIGGPVHLVSLEGSVGLVDGRPSPSLRALLARETDRGLEAFAGEIASARSVALEVFVTVLEDLALERAFDESAGVWLLDLPVARAPGAVAGAARAPASPGWSAALEASAEAQKEPAPRHPHPSVGTSPAAGQSPRIPQRRTRPGPDLDSPVPEPGDVVDHFAFGRCDVLKSDGDRLHLKVHKDGRIREIALEMLRVTRASDEDARVRFKLERRM